MMDSKKLVWNMRMDAINIVHESHASHIGAILLMVDIIAVLYIPGMFPTKEFQESSYQQAVSRSRCCLRNGIGS